MARPKKSAAKAPAKFQARTTPKGQRVQSKITKGTVTQEMVEKRARELAEIDGRGENEVTVSDLAEAKRELLGAIHPTARDEDEESVTAGTWTTPATDTGKQTPKLLPQDDQMRKELVEEGVDEAEHDQMRQAARRQRKKES